MTARIGVVTFPGSLDDRDTQRAIKLAGAEPVALWHKDKDLKQVDAVVLPGGFSYGDYLRAGAISRFSPVMETVIEQAKSGMPVRWRSSASNPCRKASQARPGNSAAWRS